MKLFFGSLVIFSSLFANAADSGLNCSMSYSSTDVLAGNTDSTSAWMVAGQELAGSAVGSDKSGGWTEKPANYISVKKNGNFWNVEILDDSKSVIGSFSFTEKQGMKATVETEAFMANESEDPPAYNKLEVSCYYTVFAG